MVCEMRSCRAIAIFFALFRIVFCADQSSNAAINFNAISDKENDAETSTQMLTSARMYHYDLPRRRFIVPRYRTETSTQVIKESTVISLPIVTESNVTELNVEKSVTQTPIVEATVAVIPEKNLSILTSTLKYDPPEGVCPIVKCSLNDTKDETIVEWLVSLPRDRKRNILKKLSEFCSRKPKCCKKTSNNESTVPSPTSPKSEEIMRKMLNPKIANASTTVEENSIMGQLATASIEKRKKCCRKKKADRKELDAED